MTIENEHHTIDEKTRVSLSAADWIKLGIGLVVYTTVAVWGVERRAGGIESNVRDHESRIVRVEHQSKDNDERMSRIIESLNDIKVIVGRIEERTKAK